LATVAGKEAIAQERVDDLETAFAEATRLHQSGDIEGAIRGYLAILAKRPELGDVRSNLGAAYARLGRYEEAINQYKQVLARDQRNQTVRYNLALAYYKAALFAEAAAEIAPLIASIPKDQPERLSAVLILADCQVRLGEYKKVIELLSPLEASYGDNRAFAYLFGNALISDNQTAKGQALIDRVFRGEDSAEARLLIGSILLLADDKHAAVKEFERALELNPKLPGLQAWYGRALMRLGDGEGAASAFKRELADNPNDFEAHLYLGILLKRDKSLDEASVSLARDAIATARFVRALSTGLAPCRARETRRSPAVARGLDERISGLRRGPRAAGLCLLPAQPESGRRPRAGDRPKAERGAAGEGPRRARRGRSTQRRQAARRSAKQSQEPIGSKFP
jgi:tetratricopeptide (TPR) repeat protein